MIFTINAASGRRRFDEIIESLSTVGQGLCSCVGGAHEEQYPHLHLKSYPVLAVKMVETLVRLNSIRH